MLRPGVTVEEAERQLILMTLKHTDGNRARAAELLGLSVKTLLQQAGSNITNQNNETARASAGAPRYPRSRSS